MSYELHKASELEQQLCRYGTSRLMVRGPKSDLTAPYLAFVGSTEVYGRFVEIPFAMHAESLLGKRCVNLGAVNAGLDSFYRDAALQQVMDGADRVVLQVMGAQNMSNDYYHVHPRRNDRFLKAHAPLHALYPEVDFTEFHFNKHLLTRLHDLSEIRFAELVAHLKAQWVTRMTTLIARVDAPVTLVWMRYDLGQDSVFALEPALVDDAMVAALQSEADQIIEIDVDLAGAANDTSGMVHGQLELPAAKLVLGPREHSRIACALADHLA